MTADQAVRATHEAAEEAGTLYERACAARGAAFALLVDSGHSYGDIASLCGISRTAAFDAVKAHRNRVTGGWVEGDW